MRDSSCIFNLFFSHCLEMLWKQVECSQFHCDYYLSRLSTVCLDCPSQSTQTHPMIYARARKKTIHLFSFRSYFFFFCRIEITVALCFVYQSFVLFFVPDNTAGLLLLHIRICISSHSPRIAFMINESFSMNERM